MALTDENGSNMVMPVSPMGGNGGFGGFGDGGWWILLLFILLGGNGFGFGGNGAGFAAATTDYAVQTGFNQAAITNGITGVQNAVVSGFGDVQTALCSGFSGVANGFAQAEIANNARQIANLQQSFAAQTATTAGMNNISNQISSCCCENRLASANLANVIQSENCADRAALSDGIRDILVAQNAGVQRILDTMCQDKIDAKNERIADLERQLSLATLSASQTAQTARILADNAAQTAAIEQYLNPVPIPAYTVPNPNTGV